MAWPLVDGEIRRVLANRFPYGVLDAPRGPSIHILAVRLDDKQFSGQGEAMGIFDLIKLLAEKKIDFVLVGGLAVALQGYQRVTMDVDVVLAMDAGNLERFISAAREAGLRPTIPVPIESLARPDLIEQWHREKGMLAFSLRSAEAQATVLDMLVKPVVPYAELRRDALMVAMGTTRVPVASIPHLIAMKTGTGRGKDQIDVDELTKLLPGSAP